MRLKKGINRMFQSSDLLVLSCLLLSAQSRTGQILPPQDVSLLWISDFNTQLSWAPPPHSVENCTYRVSSMTREEDSTETQESTSPWRSRYMTMEGGFLQLSVETVCNGTHSEPFVINTSFPELVRDLQCYITSSKHSRCSWLPASHVPDFGFFYRLSNEDGSKSIHDNSLPLLRECPRYIDTGGVRTGCDLQANFTQAIHVLFNGTLNNTLVRNTFKKWVKDDVRPPPLNWTVTKTGEKFIITWIPPDFVDLSHWTFVIDYTECKTPKVKTVEDETSLHLDLVPHCQYCMAIRAKETRGKGETRESNTTCFDADTDPNALVYVAVIIPLMFAGLAALAFVCCRKNKENIFPKVPEPRDLLSDISNNNNKITVRNLYVPAEEEDSCKITLVMDSEINQICNH